MGACWVCPYQYEQRNQCPLHTVQCIGSVQHPQPPHNTAHAALCEQHLGRRLSLPDLSIRGRQPIQHHLNNLAPSICMRSSRCLFGKTLPVSMAGVHASVGIPGRSSRRLSGKALPMSMAGVRASWAKGVASVSIFVVDSQRAGILINVPQRIVDGRSVLLPLPGLAAQRGRARGGPWRLLRLLLPLLLLLQ